MKRTFVFALVACFPFAAGMQVDDKGDDAKRVEGTWQLKEAELAGQKWPEDVVKTIQLKITGDKYTLQSNEKPDAGTFKLDPDKQPKQITITGTDGPNKGKTFPAIYEITGDTLKVCYDLSGQAHPREFKTTPGTQLFLATYKRRKG
jgi:uncharacterized protein (TIGR03067 family)